MLAAGAVAARSQTGARCGHRPMQGAEGARDEANSLSLGL